MTIRASVGGAKKEFKKVAQGNHLAICNMVADIGEQLTEYEGEKSYKPQIIYRWEFPKQRMIWTPKDSDEEKEGPMVLSRTYTLSMHEKSNLRKMMTGWMGEFSDADAALFDFGSVLGKACLANIVHRKSQKGKTYANIASVGPLVEGMESPVAELPLLLYDNDNQTMFSDLPPWVQEKIKPATDEPPF